MKNVYFVRHGETAFNIDDRYNEPDSPLNELGLKQAEIVADRFTRIPIDIIVASSMKRAVETAEIIRRKTGVKVIYSDLMREKRFPSELVGKPLNNPMNLKYRTEYAEHCDDESWHFSDEENYFDLRDRAAQAQAYLEELKQENILVVTHGTFLRILIMVMMNGADVTHENYRKFHQFVSLKNTGITYCQLSDDGVWKLITWNDHAHLG